MQEIARASKTGSATNVIIGTAVGFETTAVTAITVGLGLVVAFVLLFRLKWSVLRVLGFCGSSSRITRKTSRRAASFSRLRVSGVVPVKSS